MPHNQSPHPIDDSHTVTGRHLLTRKNTSAWRECWQLGFAKVTGLIQFHTRSRSKDHQEITSVQDRVLRIQVQMPTWLCASVLDAVFSRSYAGWTWSLNMYGHLLNGSGEFDSVTDAIEDDDIAAIHRLFQERRCRPLDWLVWDDGQNKDESLLQVSGFQPPFVHLPIPVTCGFEVVAAIC